MTTFEINIRTFRGEKKIDVDPSWTVQRLSEELYEKFRHLKIPRPEHQKLVRPDGDILEQNMTLRKVCSSGQDLVVIPRREVPCQLATPPNSLPTMPPASLGDITRAVDEELRIRAAEGDLSVDNARIGRDEELSASGAIRAEIGADAAEESLRSMVEGNFEELRGYLEQLQSAMVHHGVPGGAAFEFALPESFSSDDEEEEEEEEEGDQQQNEEREPGSGIEGEGQGLAPTAMVVPEVEEASLAELLTMGFPEQLSRNALLLHRNRLAPAVQWALDHVDDANAGVPLSAEALAAMLGTNLMAVRASRGGLQRDGRTRDVDLIQAADPEALQIMLDMGFNEEESRQALLESGNRIDDACHRLLLRHELMASLPCSAGQANMEQEEVEVRGALEGGPTDGG